jgi:O-antigen ligase
LEGSERVLRQRWLVPIIILDAAALVETVTIAPIVVAIVGVLAAGWWARRLKATLAVLIVGAFLLGLIYLPQLAARSAQQFGHAPGTTVVTPSPLIPQTIAYRLNIYKTQDIPLLKGHWLLGYGPSLPSTYSFDFTESLYFTLLLRGGVVLLAIYVALMCALFARARATARKAVDPEQRLVGRVTMLIVVMLVFVHFIEGYFVDTGPADAIWILAALVAVGPDPRLARNATLADRPWLRRRTSTAPNAHA